MVHKNMKNVKITVMRITHYEDLSREYENPIEHACDMVIGQTFVSVNAERPSDMCDAAWGVMKEFVYELAIGGGNFYDGWMKNPHSAMISCNDGFRPVSFYLESEENER